MESKGHTKSEGVIIGNSFDILNVYDNDKEEKEKETKEKNERT